MVKVAIEMVFSVGKGSESLLREVICWEGSTWKGDRELVWFVKLVEGEENSRTGFSKRESAFKVHSIGVSSLAADF